VVDLLKVDPDDERVRSTLADLSVSINEVLKKPVGSYVEPSEAAAAMPVPEARVQVWHSVTLVLWFGWCLCVCVCM
jgi:hypothetical protein